jgi:type IV pilus assembly protein PilB
VSSPDGGESSSAGAPPAPRFNVDNDLDEQPRLPIGASVDRVAPTFAEIDPDGGSRLQEIYTPGEDDAPPSVADLGRVLLERNIITKQQLTAALTVLKQSPGRRLVDVLLEQEADEEAVQRTLAELERLPFERIDLSDIDASIDGVLLQRLSPQFCKQKEIMPLRTQGSRVVIGVTRPDDVFLLDSVRRRLNVASVKPVVVVRSDILGVMESLGADVQEVDVDSILSDIEEDDVQIQKIEQDEVDLEREAGESPVIRYVNYILQTAVKEGASDIHIEPSENKLKVRFRVDGVLFEMMNPPAKMAAAITSRLKIMANLDISERRLPQDGRIRCVVQGRKLDLRVSTIPTAAGEKTVMRILDTRSISVTLDELGFDENTLYIWKKQIAEPHGIILVTGPTGSGKTTTLYSSLRQMDKQRMNISTVEDPVEYHLEGITQTQTHEKIGMNFAKALKALLRQDPDVIMIGEIRDIETATTAVQAALTGHLVLSTLHTNDAPSSVTRLINIGLEPFLVGAAINSVLAQRLVRRICEHCRAEVKPSEELAEFLEMNGMDSEKMLQGEGCDRCRGTGYAGRVGIYEMLVVDDQMRDIIARNPNVAEFRRLCMERGMVSLRQDGFQKVQEGLTTIMEVIRVTESGH